jgi:hypothetical protein
MTTPIRLAVLDYVIQFVHQSTAALLKDIG